MRKYLRIYFCCCIFAIEKETKNNLKSGGNTINTATKQ